MNDEHLFLLLIQAPVQTVIARLLSREYLGSAAREQMACVLGAVLERIEEFGGPAGHATESVDAPTPAGRRAITGDA